MPQHSTTRGSAAASSKASASSTSAKDKKRSAAGNQLSKSAARAQEKNQLYAERAVEICIENAREWVDFFANPTPASIRPLSAAEALESHHLTLARILAPKGACQFDVLLADGTEARMSVAGNIRFRGSARNKEDRTNCFIPGAVAVVNGCQLAACLNAAQRVRIRDCFGSCAPKGFFASPAAAEEADSHGDEGWEFDEASDEEEDDEKEEESKPKPSAAAGGGGGSALSAKERAALLKKAEKFSKEDEFIDSI